MATSRKTKILSREDAACIAGVIDGEGTISLSRKHRGENRQPVISDYVRLTPRNSSVNARSLSSVSCGLTPDARPAPEWPAMAQERRPLTTYSALDNTAASRAAGALRYQAGMMKPIRKPMAAARGSISSIGGACPPMSFNHSITP